MQDRIICEVRKNLQRCGYTEPLLQVDYPYQNGGGSRIPLVGFASSVRDSRTSCICVLMCSEPQVVSGEYINRYRGLGAPVVFVDCGAALQWWTIGTRGSDHKETIQASNLRAFFDRHRDKFAPGSIWRAKNLGRIDTEQQLGFVDIGLMPLLEEEMGKQLGTLMTRVIGFLREGFTADQLEQTKNQQWVFRAAFWVLCAKILKDKGVPRFVQLNLGDVDAVLGAVRTHYGAAQEIETGTKRQRSALERAAGEVDKHAGLATLTTEAFGYMYENVLVDKKLRSALGIHATPSYLVDYIVWQLWPWIKEIPEEKRVVLEPACGHAPFLTGAMRLLRELFKGDEEAFHRYAKNRLIGIEMDSFAREIARLSLTMADVPNPNGWRILEGDIYSDDTLSRQAKNATILLCNPPFEDLRAAEQAGYEKVGEQLRYGNKAAEMLWRTLPHMPDGSVFGVILPLVFLHKRNLGELRRRIVGDFELSQICLLPARVFSKADMKSVVLLGRKTRTRRKSIEYGIVPEGRLGEFKTTYRTDRETAALKRIEGTEGCDLRIVLLREIWEYCRGLATFDTVATVGRGIEYKSVKESTSRKRFAGAKEGFVRFEKTISDRKGKRKKVRLNITELPDLYWMDLSDEAIANPRYGMPTGRTRLLLNYARSSRERAWRLTPLIDEKGRAVTNCCMAITLSLSEWDMRVLYAILNSPFANAFVFCHSMERHNLESTIRKIPIPNYQKEGFEAIDRLVRKYFTLYEQRGRILVTEPSNAELRGVLLAIDAEVMRLYDLPPKMEKRVLDLFQGVQRKGVDFEFTGYYPEGFESAIPLHEYLSEEYQRSTIQFADDWVTRHRSAEINRVLREAVEAFEE